MCQDLRDQLLHDSVVQRSTQVNGELRSLPIDDNDVTVTSSEPDVAETLAQPPWDRADIGLDAPAAVDVSCLTEW